MPLIAALLFLLVLSPSIALAQEIPEYDSEAHCKRVAESAAKPSATLGRCLWLEEYALDELESSGLVRARQSAKNAWRSPQPKRAMWSWLVA